MQFDKLKNVADFISSKASDVLSSTQKKQENIPSKEISEEEELAHFERKLSAERAKTELAIKKQREKVDALTPKNIFSKMMCDTDELELEKHKLDELEERSIELNNMNAKDLYWEVKNGGGKASGEKWSSTKSSLVASILETAGDWVPVPGAPVVSKILGSIIRKE